MDLDDMTLADRIQLGTQFLDETQPDWAGRINLDHLDLADPSSCVLGQVFETNPYELTGFTYGGGVLHDWLVEKGIPDETISNAAVWGGFEREGSWEDYHLDLQDQWHAVILERVVD